jgi:cell division protein YceG involved in septum cleavage
VDEPPGLSRPTRRQAYRRRLVALVLVLAVVGASAWAAVAMVGGRDKAAPEPTTTVAAPKILRILFPEGFTRAQMAARAHRVSPAIGVARYLGATASSALPGTFAGDGKRRTLEGFLFPATYDVFDNSPAGALVKKQLDAFSQNWSKVNLGYARSKNLTPYDVLIIASMIEKEVVVAKERPLVAAVIYNRLHARMPLGIDATLRYGLGIPPTKAITKTDLASDSPYNTRRFPGLPPTPIANPGLASIQAAAHPAKVDYLYFVRKPDCRSHFFTASIEEFDSYTRKGLTDC